MPIRHIQKGFGEKFIPAVNVELYPVQFQNTAIMRLYIDDLLSFYVYATLSRLKSQAPVC